MANRVGRALTVVQGILEEGRHFSEGDEADAKDVGVLGCKHDLIQ
jgi:hypothetical protein